jgi:hypothetical protein
MTRMPTYLYMVIALAVGFVLGFAFSLRRGRAEYLQNRGEARLSRLTCEYFHGPDYHLLNHITIQLEDGTTQVDHILVSRFGVFVIETKDYSGWIFANSKAATWTQVIFKAKFKFQNPIFQNLRHVRAVQGLLDFLPPHVVKSVVVFAGEAEFKSEVPSGVFSLSGFLKHVQAQTVEVMSVNRVQFCVGRLETVRLAVTGETDIEHVRNLHRRHGGSA